VDEIRTKPPFFKAGWVAYTIKFIYNILSGGICGSLVGSVAVFESEPQAYKPTFINHGGQDGS